MERPKVTVEPTVRRVTGETVYLDDMRRADQWPGNYLELPDMAIQMYEESAALYESQDVRPEIMDLYDRYDATLDDLHGSCAALCKELLALKKKDSIATSVDVIVEMSASAIIERLESTRLGELLAKPDEQLAIESNGEYYPVLDIKKCDAQLVGAGVTVWGWSQEPKYFMVPREEGKPLCYPSGEQTEWFQLDIDFSYRHPQAGSLTEIITLSVGTQGELSLSSKVHASVYAEQGYEGHTFKQLENQTDDDIVQFVDLAAEIVGDEPLSGEQYHMRQLERYLERLCIAESAEYIREWIENSWSAQVVYDLQNLTLKDSEGSLAKALLEPELATAAHKQLVRYVNKQRSTRNKNAADTSMREYYGEMKPWQDRVER